MNKKNKMKIFSKELRLHNVPYERIVYDDKNINEAYVLVDDFDEKCWKIKIKMSIAIKITDIDCVGFDFRYRRGDFPDDCFEIKEGYPFPQFRKYIMEVPNSKWIKKLKKAMKKIDYNDYAGATGGRINPQNYGHWGHSDSYWKGTRGGYVSMPGHKNGIETWAEYVSLKMSKDQKGLQAFQDLLPQTHAKYEQMYSKLREVIK